MGEPINHGLPIESVPRLLHVVGQWLYFKALANKFDPFIIYEIECYLTINKPCLEQNCTFWGG